MGPEQVQDRMRGCTPTPLGCPATSTASYLPLCTVGTESPASNTDLSPDEDYPEGSGLQCWDGAAQ